jgi:hypothetical protein
MDNNTITGIYIKADGKFCGRVKLNKSKILDEIRRLIWPGVTDYKECYLEGFNFGKCTEGQPSGWDCIFMDECGSINGSVPNPQLPAWYGNLLILGLDDDGHEVSCHTPFDDITREIRESARRKEQRRLEFFRALGYDGPVNGVGLIQLK